MFVKGRDEDGAGVDGERLEWELLEGDLEGEESAPGWSGVHRKQQRVMIIVCVQEERRPSFPALSLVQLAPTLERHAGCHTDTRTDTHMARTTIPSPIPTRTLTTSPLRPHLTLTLPSQPTPKTRKSHRGTKQNTKLPSVLSPLHIPNTLISSSRRSSQLSTPTASPPSRPINVAGQTTTLFPHRTAPSSSTTRHCSTRFVARPVFFHREGADDTWKRRSMRSSRSTPTSSR